jgi:hypothetical protein
MRALVEHVKELLLTQDTSITADTAGLEALSSELEGWKLEHPELELPARLTKLGMLV